MENDDLNVSSVSNVTVEEVKSDNTQIPHTEACKEEPVLDFKVNVGHTEKFNPYEASLEEVVKSKGFISSFINFIKSSRFAKKIREVASNKRVSEKAVAKNFFSHILGTLGDIGEIVFNTVEDIIVGIIGLLSNILVASSKIICNTARGLLRVVTLNNTCLA